MTPKKTGPTFVIPYHRAQDLAKQIDSLQTQDQELIRFAEYLRSFVKGVALVCVAEEDFILWPGGPDIRDFQIGGAQSKVTVVLDHGTYSNDPLDLEPRSEK